MTISFVQSATGSQGTPPVLGAGVTPGSTVIWVAGFYSGLPESATGLELGSTVVSGTQQLVFPQTAGGGSGDPQGLLIAMLPNVQVSGQTEVNFTTSGSIVGMAILEFSGLGPNPVMDQFVINDGASSSVTSGSTPATLWGPELIIGAGATYDGSTTAPTPAGWNLGPGNSLLGIQGHLTVGYQIQTTPGQTYSWTQPTAAAEGWAAAIVTIRASSSLPMGGFI